MKQSKRYLLATAGPVIFLIALAAYNTSTLAGQGGRGAVAPELEGTWRVTVTPDGPNPAFSALHTFASGGVMLESNQSDQSSQVKQTPGHGVWERKGPHTFGFTFEKFAFDSSGVFIGKLRIRETLQLSSKNSYTGQATGDVFDPNGNLLLSFCARTQATRMVVEEPSCP
jgi:hypothetical protein